MTTISNTNSIRDQDRTDYQQNYISRQGDNVLSRGIAVMYMFMNLLSEMADSMYADMQSQSDITREAQSMANRVDSAIATAARDGDKGSAAIDQATYEYMYDNNITVNGQSINDYLGISGGKSTNVSGIKKDQGELKSIKSALETVSNQASDYVSQSQLQLQKLMQTYNVTVSLINSMQTMLADMNKSIAQNIR
ncbi:secretion protein EspA [Shewanella surugensis]|uniref:Secretion protein EspA n=1 Tax=Shewanella surugensis TaxID=212020 RepID=A0ABT0L824_9GAMM|nr:secretion protein EspA [Shewanella surugensis]MCL1123699.1 secretion protein EspA [Shewanella surugensis]